MQRLVIIFFTLISFSGFSQTYLDFYFKSKDVDGAILIYDEGKDSWLFNKERDVKRKTPVGSLFNLQTTLIALDLGIITNSPESFMAWDGVKRYYFNEYKTTWNCNTNLDEALLFKNDWYFQKVSDLIREKDYHFFLKHINTTNLNFNKKEKYYWHFGNLYSTPEQQIAFLKKLKKQEFYFNKENQKYLYDKLLLVSNNNYSIYGYETYNVYKGEKIDWWIGVLETKDNNYYFSTRVFENVDKDKSSNFSSKKFEITIEIFKLLGFIN